jgi:hypothetical protein
MHLLLGPRHSVALMIMMMSATEWRGPSEDYSPIRSSARRSSSRLNGFCRIGASV